MPGEGLKIDRRRSRILELLSRDGRVWVAQLSEELGATPVTIRSDLTALERDGYLERIKGGAVKTASSSYNIDFRHRKQASSAEKKRIAAAVASMIRDGDSLMINSGTTTYYVAMELHRCKNLSVITNSLAVATELGGQPSIRVILLGGEINAQFGFTSGIDAHEQIGKYWADYAILSMDGVSAERGITNKHGEEVLINQLMVRRASKTIVVADRSKLGRDSFSVVAGIKDVDHLVTSGELSPEEREEFTRKGVEVTCV